MLFSDCDNKYFYNAVQYYAELKNNFSKIKIKFQINTMAPRIFKSTPYSNQESNKLWNKYLFKFYSRNVKL